MASLCKKKGARERRCRGVTSRLCASEVGHRSEWNREPTPRGEERVCQRTRVARTRTGKYGEAGAKPRRASFRGLRPRKIQGLFFLPRGIRELCPEGYKKRERPSGKGGRCGRREGKRGRKKAPAPGRARVFGTFQTLRRGEARRWFLPESPPCPYADRAPPVQI